MHIFTTVLLGILVLLSEAITGSAQFLQRWLSGCLISVILFISVVGGIAGIFVLGSFIFNL